MKHLTFGDKTLFVGDAAAATLLEYASRLADAGSADTVDLTAVGPDGHSVVAIARMEQAMSDLRVPPITEMSSEQLSALADPLDEGTTSQG